MTKIENNGLVMYEKKKLKKKISLGPQHPLRSEIFFLLFQLRSSENQKGTTIGEHVLI